MSGAAAAGAPAPAEAAALAAQLAAFERELDPARPTALPGVELLGYGEVSAVLALPALPGRVCKRMAGFRDEAAADRYRELVARYVAALRAAGVAVVDTALVPVALPRRRPVVYLLQPRLDPAALGQRLLREAPDPVWLAALDGVLEAVLRVHRANAARRDGRAVALDAQLSNWHFGDPARPGPPRLVDVGTPFMRLDKRDELDPELLLAAVPPGIRAWYRRQRAVERYLDDYFEPRRVLVDLLGNFHKEGRADRLEPALAAVNRWLAAHGAALAGADGAAPRPITRADVDRYYARDAAQLERFLRVRRLDRFVRTRLLRRRYEFVLPGAIRRR